MNRFDPGGRVGRGAAELIIVIAGVVLGLAVDRWVAGLDENARADAWAAELADDLLQDSLQLTSLLQDFDSSSVQGIRLLELMADPSAEIEDPSAFVATLEGLAWWIPFDPRTETWDEIGATGQLGIFRGDSVRIALTAYHGVLDYISDLEDRWAPTFADYWRQEQAVIPPLLRVGAMDCAFHLTGGREVTMGDAEEILAVFRADPARQGALATAVMTYRYGTPVMRSVIPRITTARRALLAR